MTESPCKNICVPDESKKYCTGCYRTLDEIARWDSTTELDKLDIVKNCEIRSSENEVED